MTGETGNAAPIDVAAPSLPSLWPNPATLLVGTSSVALVSLVSLPWPLAIASTVLGLLMIAGTDVDARTLLLPDIVTYGATACGILAAPLLVTSDPWFNLGAACLRAGGTAAVLAGLRFGYMKLRGREGLGLGDVKLAAAVGAWLPLEAIPYCFGLASAAALVWVTVALRDESTDSMKLPLGAFLCPALWLVFFVFSTQR
ncbi:A24 family peptidase [Methylovirgula sp. HY1]|uniref:prepilin peptidase n=1 Tax=Methylovirgula sp. HY1 TaxID=2822761 RepID=UPI001C5AB48F|nr:A24 family peptidase [Methylovirgula sp. HY1]QXX76267.1 Type 4 prepilin-like proteins leader peptide-processing enzyme [Methylovirgula sp. HY1]